MKIVVPNVAEALYFLTDEDLDLLSNLVSNGNRIVDSWLQTKVLYELTCKCLWLIVRIAYIPSQSICEQRKVQVYLDELLSLPLLLTAELI